MKTLNVIGPGRVGRTLAALWRQAGVVRGQAVLGRSAGSAESAVAFIGDGRGAARLEDMRAAGVWMLAVPDAAIRACCERLAASGLLRGGDVVFHCSGALAADELASAAARGAATASVHALKSFADAAAAVRSFRGTHCAAEGAAAALALLKPAFERIGAAVAEIDPAFKPVYHAASVIVCNYLVALMETGLRCYDKAGIPRGTAAAMMEPLVRETVDNVFALGTARALTGPIARGDATVVARQLAALGAWDARTGIIYRELGAVALEIARARGDLDAAALARLEALLNPAQGERNA